MGEKGPGAGAALRDLAGQDLPALYRLAAMASFPPGQVPTEARPAEARVRRWLDGWAGPGELGVGWEERGALRGAAWARRVAPVLARDDAGEVVPEVIVAVEEDARGRGIGCALVSALVERAREAGWSGLALTVSPRNPAAIAVYRRSGFRALVVAEPRIRGRIVMARVLDRSTTLRACDAPSDPGSC